MELRFRSDTKYRKEWFSGVSFSHPAKMSLPLQLWIIERYTEASDVILDPMAGSGTILIACSLGRNVIVLDLEQKFVDMMRGNWEKIQQRGPQLGYTMGWAIIRQGDARNLEGLLADKVIFSPPYAKTEATQRLPDTAASKGGQTKYTPQSLNTNIGNLSYGNIDAVITSPPYEGIEARDRSKENWWDEEREKRYSGGSIKIAKGYQVNSIITSPPYENVIAEGDAGPLAHASYDPDFKDKRQGYTSRVDAVITSPPYGDAYSIREGGQVDHKYVEKAKERLIKQGKRKLADSLRVEDYNVRNPDNIGNLKRNSYLSAMFLVYRQCFKVLKPGGLMILVVKPFIRNQQIIPLQEHTKALCKRAGFSFVEEHHRMLLSQSFWRTLYAHRFPNAPKIDKEYILVFKR